jgi:ferric-dicitrate binding protein FerR (iron transport regulator)
VSARPGDETVEVTVETGKVQVSCTQLAQQPGNGLILLPGERGVLQTMNNQLTRSVNEDPNLTAWKTHNLIFSNTPLKEVIEILGKVYHTDIQVSDPALNDFVLTAHFDQQPVDFILEVIRLTFNLELSAKNGQYFLTAVVNK